MMFRRPRSEGGSRSASRLVLPVHGPRVRGPALPSRSIPRTSALAHALFWMPITIAACSFDADSLRAVRDGQAEATGGQGGASDGRADTPVDSRFDSLDTPVDSATEEVPPKDALADAAPDLPTGPGLWSARSPSTAPSPRAVHALVYDSARKKTVLFGGGSCGGYGDNNETWEWDGVLGTWTNRTPSPRPASWPRPLWAPGLAYDVVRARTVLFGGFDETKITGVDETWEWNGSAGSWTNRTPSPRPASWPAGRNTYGGITFDAKRMKVILFGGYSYTTGALGDLWEWDGIAGTWTNRTPSPLPPSWPPARGGHVLAFDATSSRAVLFGGNSLGAAGYLNDLWEWDGAAGTWTNRTPVPLPAVWPAPIVNAALAFDYIHGRLVLFGSGRCDKGGSSDLWEWDGPSNVWVNRTPASLPASWPPARAGARAAFDAGRNLVVMFGGGNMTGSLGDTWEWTAP